MGLTSIPGKHHFTLGTIPFRVQAQRYQKYTVTPFAPRVAAEDPSHSTLDAWQAETWTDWSHGFGFIKSLDKQGYDNTAGALTTYNPGLLTMSAQVLVPAGTTGVAHNCFAVYSNNWYSGLASAYSSSTVAKYNRTTDSWEAVTGAGYPTVAITDMCVFSDTTGNPELAIACADGLYYYDGSTFSEPVAGLDCKYLAVAGGYAWHSTYTTSANKASVRYSSDPQAAWSDYVKVGSTAHAITNLAAFAGRLYICKTDGVYYVDPTQPDVAYPAALFPDEIHDNNGKVFVANGGYLYFNIRATLWKLSPTHALADVTPPPFGWEYPLLTHASFQGGCSAGKHLWVLAQATRDSTTNCSLLAYDGIGWHRAHQGLSSLNNHLAYDVADGDNPRIWLARSSGAARYMQMRGDSLIPYANFDITAQGVLHTSQITFDMDMIEKHWRSVQLESPQLYAQTKVATVAEHFKDAPGPTGWDDFSSISNLSTVDGAAAEAIIDILATSQIHFGGFGFTIPTNATIVGVKFQAVLAMSGTANTVNDTHIFLSTGDDLSIADTGSDQAGSNSITVGGGKDWVTVSVGSSSSVWGATLTPAIVNGTLGVHMTWTPTAGFTLGDTWRADQVLMTVYYHYGGTGDFTNDVGGSIAVYYYLDESPIGHLLGTLTQPNLQRYTTYDFPEASGTLDSATSTTVTDNALNQAAGYWAEATLYLLAGTGAGQSRKVLGSTAAGVLTLDSAFTTTPDSTTIYRLSWSSKSIRLKYVFSTTVASKTPVLLASTLRYLPRPDQKNGWRITVPIPRETRWGTGAAATRRGPMALQQLINNWRGFKTPLPFVDVDESSYTVLITEATFRPTGVDSTAQGGDINSWEWEASLVLVQV